MIRIANVVLIATAALVGTFIASSAQTRIPPLKNAPPAPEKKELASTSVLLPPEEGVIELKFSDLYQSPVGPRGLEFSDTLKSLVDKRVRILGYMVRNVHPNLRGFMLSPYPVTYDKCTADSLPTTAIHVVMPPSVKAGYTEGMLLLTGRLSLGGKEDPFGQVSHIRLLLDPPPAPIPAKDSSQTQAH